MKVDCGAEVDTVKKMLDMNQGLLDNSFTMCGHGEVMRPNSHCVSRRKAQCPHTGDASRIWPFCVSGASDAKENRLKSASCTVKIGQSMPLIARLADLVKVLHNLLALSGRTDRNGNKIDPSLRTWPPVQDIGSGEGSKSLSLIAP